MTTTKALCVSIMGYRLGQCASHAKIWPKKEQNAPKFAVGRTIGRWNGIQNARQKNKSGQTGPPQADCFLLTGNFVTNTSSEHAGMGSPGHQQSPACSLNTRKKPPQSRLWDWHARRSEIRKKTGQNSQPSYRRQKYFWFPIERFNSLDCFYSYLRSRSIVDYPARAITRCRSRSMAQ